MSNRLIELQLFHLRLPFKRSFVHAAAQRSTTDTVVAAALLADGTVGYGEGLPREYVTGETVESVFYNASDTLTGHLDKLEPATFADLLDRVDNLPFVNEQDRVINSARCCVELALLDAYGKYFKSSLAQIAGWLGYGAFSGHGSIDQVRVSGVLDGSQPQHLGRTLRKMRWFGMRDFKLKLGCEHDQDNLALLTRRLGRALEREKVTLRVDANGSWDVDTAVAMSEELARMGVCYLEQPLAADDRSHWVMLGGLSHVDLMADESLVSLDDAEYLAQNDLVDMFNIRISKNGGLLSSVRIAEIAAKYHRQYQLGAMVGESSILAAAGRQFLQMVPQARFTEICYSTYLLQEDLTRQNMRFGYGGKLKPLAGSGLGVEISREKITKFLVGIPKKIPLA